MNAEAQGGSPFGGMSPEEFFANVFGGFGGFGPFGDGFGPFGEGRRSRHRAMRTPDVAHSVKVELEDLFQGKTIRIDFNRKIVCPTCKGMLILTKWRNFKISG